MNSKRLYNIIIVLCCAVALEFILLMRVVTAPAEIKEVEVVKEVEVPVTVEVVKEVEVIKEVTVEVPVEVPVETAPAYVYEISSDDREMLARLVYLEANIESLECQKAIASVVINRWQCGSWGNSLTDVVYAQDQFTPSGEIWRTTPMV